ncbi:MAG: winged helix-turn-helix transcriptional regulator [Candidatus Aenigmarchaeota archaeon]|nr:winged helix-turn-helix transcriptional regulator [Candidatus Aenigmarchaeota archaeon]
MEITKKTIKALSSDTRLEILKILVRRRKIAADISKQLKMAPSTVNEHMKILEEAGLIQRKNTGHKWIYFEVTEQGRNLVQPKSPMQFVLILTLGIVMMFIGGFRSLVPSTGEQTFAVPMASKGMEITEEAGRNAVDTVAATPAAGIDWLIVLFVVVGIILVIIGLYNIVKMRK